MQTALCRVSWILISYLGLTLFVRHGSGLVNFNGILSQGLRIAPPEADASGYAFGKGTYFADRFLKSYGYCRDEHVSVKCLLLSDVGLGKEYLAHQVEYMERPPEGYDSTHALANSGPDECLTQRTVEGVQVPVGPIVEEVPPVDWTHPSESGGGYFATSQAEYIVYDERQVALRYLVVVGPARRAYREWLNRCEKKQVRRALKERQQEENSRAWL